MFLNGKRSEALRVQASLETTTAILRFDNNITESLQCTIHKNWEKCKINRANYNKINRINKLER